MMNNGITSSICTKLTIFKAKDKLALLHTAFFRILTDQRECNQKAHPGPDQQHHQVPRCHGSLSLLSLCSTDPAVGNHETQPTDPHENMLLEILHVKGRETAEVRTTVPVFFTAKAGRTTRAAQLQSDSVTAR